MTQTDLEDRLRAAYRARAELVTSDALTHEAPTPPGRTDRPRVAPLLAAAAVVLLAIAAVVIAHYANKKSPPAELQLRFTTPHVKLWQGIGPGWTIAIVSTKADSPRAAVMVVDPDGATGPVVAELDDAQSLSFGDVSADGSHIVLFKQVPNNQRQPVVTVDLTTGTVSHYLIPREQGWDGFATPDGSTQRLRTDLGLRIVNGAGVLQSVQPIPQVEHIIDGLDGSTSQVLINGRQGYVNVNQKITVGLATGEVLTTLPAPAGSCGSARPWTATSLRVVCAAGMWQVPLDGSPAVELVKRTPDVATGLGAKALDAPYRLLDVGRVNGVLYGLEARSCGGAVEIARIGADLVPHRITRDEIGGLPVAGGMTGFGAGSFHYVSLSSGCKPHITGELYSFDPSTNEVTALLARDAPGDLFVRTAITIPDPGSWSHLLPSG